MSATDQTSPADFWAYYTVSHKVQRKLTFVQKLLQAPSDVIRTCAYMYTVSRENDAFLCEKFHVYIGNFGGNNVKVKTALM